MLTVYDAQDPLSKISTVYLCSFSGASNKPLLKVLTPEVIAIFSDEEGISRYSVGVFPVVNPDHETEPYVTVVSVHGIDQLTIRACALFSSSSPQ